MIRIKYYIAIIFVSSMSILISTSVLAQHTVLHGDTLIVNNDARFWINEELIFGSGTMPDKSYSYIYEAPTGFQKIVANHKRKLLPSAYKGAKSRIIKFEKALGHNKKEFDYTILVLEMPNGDKYWCEVRNAYADHEIVTNASGNGAQLSKNDSKDDANDVKNKKPASKKSTSKKKTASSNETTIF